MFILTRLLSLRSEIILSPLSALASSMEQASDINLVMNVANALHLSGGTSVYPNIQSFAVSYETPSALDESRAGNAGHKNLITETVFVNGLIGTWLLGTRGIRES